MALQTVVPPPPPVLLPPAADHQSTLYVGDLHPDTTENDLHFLFSMAGSVNSVRICRDRFSHKSLCYAYIKFDLVSHAALALSRLNHTELKGKPMRIMWCERDPFGRRTGVANLFVKNIDSFVTDAEFEEVFRKFGRILSCKIAKDDNGKSKGFGFVQFDSEESANNALNALDGTTLNEKIISVAKFLKKNQRKQPEFTNVYVKNLDLDFTEDLLKEKFSEYGNVTSAVIMNNAEGKSRGFGFVNFESPDSAKKAIEALNGSTIGSKEWFVGKAMTKSEREGFLKLSQQKDKTNPASLFVKNLASSVDKQTLEKTFGEFGNIVSATVVRYKNGVSKGFGFVCFSNPEEGNKACSSLNGKLYHGKNMHVSVALSKEARFASQPNFGNNLYFQPNYRIQSQVRAPFYDPYWQTNFYRNMQVLPNLKPQSYQENVHSSYEKDQKPFMGFNTHFSKGALAKEHHQKLNSVKRSGLKGLGKAFLKVQVKNEGGLQGNLSYYNGSL